MRKASRRTLSLVLSFLMTLSVGVCDFSLVSFAKEESTKTNHVWTSINLEDISADDSIAITMTTEDGETYVLPSLEATNSGPVAKLSTVENGSLTISDGKDGDYAWKITKHTVTTKSKKNDQNDSEPKEDEVLQGSLEASTEKSDSAGTGISTEEDNSKDDTDKSEGEKNNTEDEKNNTEEEKGNTVTAAKNVLATTPAADKTETADETDPQNATEPKETEESAEVEKVEEYYTISSGSNQLITNADNNGVRVKAKSDDEVGAKWKIDKGYLCAVDPKDVTRYLGVYNKTDFRAYKLGKEGAFPGNIKDQTLGFYKLTDQTIGGEVSVPKASIKSGESVDYGAEITLTCATEDAKIYYNTNDTENYSPYVEPIKVNKDLTIHAYAQIGEEETGEKSETVSFEYTLKKGVKIKDLTSLIDGQEFVLVNGDKAAMSNSATDKKLSPVAVELDSDNVLTCKEDIEKLATLKLEKKSDDSEAYYITTEFTDSESGETAEYYLTSGATGSELYFTKAPENKEERDDLGLWTFEDLEDGNFRLKNVKALFNSSKPQYLEYYSKAFTTYSYNSTKDNVYVFSAYTTPGEGEEVNSYESDPDTELIVAQWGGGAEYPKVEDTDKYIYADLYETNDMKDTDSKYSVVVGGNVSVPYTSAAAANTGSTNYYMGSKGVVSKDDYIQMEFPTQGFADMKLGFRMRSSNTAVGAYQLQYSTTGEDGSFKNIKDGSYKYSITVYKDDKPSEKKGDGEINDGIARTSLAPAKEVSFEFKIPEGANNKEKVYIRLVPATTLSAKGDKDAGPGGVNRIDSVMVLGHPIVSDDICGHIVADPSSGEVAEGTKIALSTRTEGADIYYSVNGGDEVKYDADAKVTLDELPAIIRAYATKDGMGNSITSVYQYKQAQVATVTANPNGGAIAQSQKITLKTKTEGATILYRYKTKSEIAKEDKDGTSGNTEAGDLIEEETEDNHHDWKEYTEPFTAKELPAQIQVKAVKEGYLDSAVSTLKFTKRVNERDNIYFGQIHAHTNISDGAGSLEDAYDHAKNVDNLDFIIITDHSNSIDNESESKITENVDKSPSDEWTYAHNLAKQKSTEDFTCAYGYEMTWSNGLGHMNTFNTEGFQSRTQSEYSAYATALNNYYSALRTAPDSISQFNHPGTTFGDFQDFAYYSEENDNLITMIEVGNGEGAIGSSGYFPSYEYYIRALDKGWHVAPTNNQDNHKGLWGDANTARTVMLADTNTEEAIYDAMRNYRIYATEDNDLSIYYTLDGNVMGSILDKEAVGDTVEIKADIKEPTDKAIGKVELIVNGGQVISSINVDKTEATVKFTAPSAYSYYLIKVTEGDKDIAVTAPVWVGEVEACGINKTYTDTVLPVAGEELDVNVEFYNNEKTSLEINNIKVELSDVDGKVTPVSEVTGEEAKVKEIASNGTATYQTKYTYDQAGQVTYQITVNATLDGVEKVYKDKLTVNYVLPKMVSEVIIDGTHANDYVSGYYTDNVSAFVNLCAGNNIRARVIKDEITSEMLSDCKLLVISAPAKSDERSGLYKASHYSDEFIELVKDYVQAGGSVIICGLADYKDSTSVQTATEQNKLLSAMGSTIRMGSDEVCDDTNNGGQVYRMYPTNFNLESDLLAGIKNGQVYSQYSGCSVDISSATATDFVDEAEWLVKGFDTTYSVDCKSESGASQGSALPNAVVGIKNDNEGDITFLARQKTKAGGQIIVGGGVFLSDFEVKAEIDNNDSLPYANYTIVNNIIQGATVNLETTTIADARKGKMNEVFAVEGYVTSGTDNENTTFFDTIYIQDETGGMDIFPYATPGLKIGTKMRIVGFLAQYQGDLELKVISAKALNDAPKVWEPKVVDTKTAMDYDKLGGQLLQTTGEVTRVTNNADGTVAEFWLKDSTGKEAAIFIDGYIKSGTTGKNTLGDFVKKGANVTAAGVLYKHPEGKSDVSVPVFRVRNCDDIFLAKESSSGNQGGDDSSDNGSTNSGSSHGNGGSGSDSNGSDTGNTTPNTGAATAASSGASIADAATASSTGTGEQITTGQTGSTGTDSSHSNGGGNSQQDNAGEGGNSQVSEGDNGGNGGDNNSQQVDVQAGGDDQLGDQVTPPTDNKPGIPVVPVAVGLGIISVAAVTVVVVKVTLGTTIAASAASGSKLAGLLVKLLHIFGK
ncbi:CehA/McbA family metallohydrolase [Butyrivibrio sp. INlla21]|uniref:CehA/McbA family metallohydrolase n=1 Tax=Butyrivibrio sp. INlla21 TaxID=1520811 RepID=UPI0008EDB449|nr:CehA/McbA family metallohydrolase [Butyrivibrio sp. INlla21]SFU74372.1 Chitobiase/beta-hexosaminidase C-terminal domain-containing protein [Butyrivibrio sp. INlla21]